jgi:hypothetical protein
VRREEAEVRGGEASHQRADDGRDLLLLQPPAPVLVRRVEHCGEGSLHGPSHSACMVGVILALLTPHGCVV